MLLIKAKSTLYSRFVVAILNSFVLIFAFSINAIGESNPTDSLGDQDRAEIIDSVASIFIDRYVYPEVGLQMDSVLKENLADGVYDDQSSLSDFSQSIMRDLRQVSNDRHIWVEPIPEDRFYVAEGDTITDEQIFSKSLNNFGWMKVEWLAGAVGYIKVDKFEDVSYARETAEAALNFMANCQIIIMDLREHHGGHKNMNHLVVSYFFSEPTELSSLYWTYLDSMQESWTHADIKGRPLYDKELYILTSNNTASGAEAFAYDMKHLGRATIVGENTAGAAHWSDWYEFPSLELVVHLPVARPINPVTKDSWEGTGVRPDIIVPAEKALDTAYLEAVAKLKSSTRDKKLQRLLEWTIPAIQARLNPVEVDDVLASKIIGNYVHEDGKKKYNISYENGSLLYNHHSGNSWIIIPLTETLYGFEDNDDVRVKFIEDNSGAITEFQIMDQSGIIARRARMND